MFRCRHLLSAILASFALKMAVAEEEGPSDTSVSMAATLIGTISFMMCLYYFINYDDKDIRQKTWETISNTISIFCAVLLFSAFNDMVEAYLIEPLFGEGDLTYGALLVDATHMLIWIALMQFVTAWLSGAAGPWAVDSDKLSEAELKEVKEVKENNMSCWGVLFAHICGFASINCFGTAQGLFFGGSPAMSYGAVPLAFFCMLGLQRVTDTIRTRISKGDDGTTDEFEDLWDEATEEAENDVMGLALSFTMMGAIRFSLTGCLPNSEGKEEECKVEEYLFHHTIDQKISLLGVGVVFALLIFVLRFSWPEWSEKEETDKIEDKKERHRMELIGRTLEGLYVAVAMCFSWAMFYGIQMVLAGFACFEGADEVLSVTVAMVVFFLMIFGLLPLDKLADQDWTGPKCDRALRSLMEAMAILIGFAWEQCFDTSVDAIAEKSDHLQNDFINPHTVKLGLSIFCASLLIPAWKKYILPFMAGEGWRFGPVYNIEQLGEVAKRLIDEDSGAEEEAEEEAKAAVEEKEEAGKKKKKKKADKEKLGKVLEVLDDVHADGCERVEGEKPPKPKALQATAMSKGYEALPGDDVEALKAKNQALVSEIEKAKAASIKAQQMLDETMENMMMSMKNMHDTVGRIEASA
jgi:hypothetical protein